MRYVKALVWLPLVVIWVVLDQREPFRSHFWLTVVCALASATPIAIAIAIFQHRKKQQDKNSNA
jgi:hypothetical protein